MMRVLIDRTFQGSIWQFVITMIPVKTKTSVFFHQYVTMQLHHFEDSGH